MCRQVEPFYAPVGESSHREAVKATWSQRLGGEPGTARGSIAGPPGLRFGLCAVPCLSAHAAAPTACQCPLRTSVVRRLAGCLRPAAVGIRGRLCQELAHLVQLPARRVGIGHSVLASLAVSMSAPASSAAITPSKSPALAMSCVFAVDEEAMGAVAAGMVRSAAMRLCGSHRGASSSTRAF